MWPFSAIANAYARSRAHRRAIEEIGQLISLSLGNGVLSRENEKDIVSRCTALGLSDRDIRPLRLPAYSSAVEAVTTNGDVTDDQVRNIERIQHFLKLPDKDVATQKQKLQRALQISQIHRGHLATVEVAGVVRKKNETLHWRESASLMEERVVDRKYVGGSHGVSIRIAKGLTYRVGAQRGHIVTEKAMVPVSTGNLVISNLRVMFLGNKKSFNVLLGKIMDIHMYADGLQLTDDAGRQRLVQFDGTSNADLIAATLQCVVNATKV
jgi:hypothetical protein